MSGANSETKTSGKCAMPLFASAFALVMACSSATAQPTGSAAGGAISGANDGLDSCDKTLGVLRIEEDTRSAWYRHYYARLGSQAPLLHLMIMQANCFVVMERRKGDS